MKKWPKSRDGKKRINSPWNGTGSEGAKRQMDKKTDDNQVDRSLQMCRARRENSCSHSVAVRPRIEQMPRSHGFTVIELIVVMFLLIVLMALAGMYSLTYYDEYRFSSAARTLHNAILLARIRAIEGQSTVWLIPRPAGPANAGWITGQSYAVGTHVDNKGLTYRCSIAHSSSATNEPGVGSDWQNKWVAAVEYRFTQSLFAVKDCTGAATPESCRNAAPYNSANPVRVEFSWRGFTTDYLDHELTIGGVPPLRAGRPSVKYTIKTMGKIEQGPGA